MSEPCWPSGPTPIASTALDCGVRVSSIICNLDGDCWGETLVTCDGRELYCQRCDADDIDVHLQHEQWLRRLREADEREGHLCDDRGTAPGIDLAVLVRPWQGG